MVMMTSNEDFLGLVPFRFLISLNCLDHFPVDPALAPVRATKNQLVTLCRSVCVEERAQILDPLIARKRFTTYFITFVAFISSLYFPVHRIRCCSSTFGTGCCTFCKHVADTSDSSADESQASHPRRRVPSKRTYKMKKVWELDEVGRFFVTGATDAARKPNNL